MLNFLGRGSAFNTKEGNTSAFHLYDNGETLLLIDCGETTFSNIMKLGIMENVKKVEIFITHNHPDHIGSLGSLIFYCYYKKKIRPKLFNVSPHIFSSIINILSLMGVNGLMYDIIYSHKFLDAFAFVYHTESMPNTLYVFKGIGDRPIIYTGDTCDITAVLSIYQKYKDDKPIVYTDCCIAEYKGNVHMSLDTLINNIELVDRDNFHCMHFDSDEAIKKARDNGFNIVRNTFKARLLSVYDDNHWIDMLPDNPHSICRIFNDYEDSLRIELKNFKSEIVGDYEFAKVKLELSV